MLAKVAAIFRPIRPDLPRPVTDDPSFAGVEQFYGFFETLVQAIN